MVLFIMLMRCLIRLCFAAIVSRVDPESANYLKQSRRKATSRKMSSFELIGAGNLAPPVDVVPPKIIVPPVNPKKRGWSTKSTQQRVEALSSSQQPTMLGQHLQRAQGVQVAMTSEEESILAVVLAKDLVVELAEIHSCALVAEL